MSSQRDPAARKARLAPLTRRHGSGRGWTVAVLVAATAVAGCTSIPPPDILAELQRIREVPASLEAKRYAPPAYERAEQLRQQAEDAFERGEHATSQILGEQAVAAYAHAAMLARVARAEEQLVAAEGAAETSDQALAELDAEHQQLAAEISALELRLKILRDAEPHLPSPAAGPKRERARREAVDAMRLQARLLCTAAQLLAQRQPAKPPELAAARQKLDELAELLAASPAAPIDHAMRARAACLQALTLVRRTGQQAKPVQNPPGGADALLQTLTVAGHGTPRRDDRGVVVTLRGLFAGEKLTKAGHSRLAELAQTATAHPRYPLLVVVHQDLPTPPAQERRWQKRGQAVVTALGGNAALELAGTSQPVVDPASQYRSRNARVEIVFVSPHTL